jgi:hypothetical protein
MKPDRSDFPCVFALVATPVARLVTFLILIRGDGRIREDGEGKNWGEEPATGAAAVSSFATSLRRRFKRVDRLGLIVMLDASAAECSSQVGGPKCKPCSVNLLKNDMIEGEKGNV